MIYCVLDRSKEISIFFLIYHLDGFDWREKSMTVKYEESGVLVQKVKMNTKDVRWKSTFGTGREWYMSPLLLRF